MNAVVLWLLLFQNADYASAARSSIEASKRETQLRGVATALTNPQPRSVAEESAQEYAQAKDDAFVAKFNALVNKLMDFSDSYKSKNAIDVKKAAAVRKAWRELEKSEALFREDPKK
jgi:hypothetical protein